MKGAVIWITGLSGTGKTTVANAVSAKLRAQGHCVVHLDGDEIRATLPKSAVGYSREDRLALATHYAGLAHIAYKQGLCVVVSTVSLFKEIHVHNRQTFHRYLEVLLNVPLNVLRQRDTLGVYSSGDKTPVFGIDLSPELPSDSETLVIQNYGSTAAHDCADIVMDAFSRVILADARCESTNETCRTHGDQ